MYLFKNLFRRKIILNVYNVHKVSFSVQSIEHLNKRTVLKLSGPDTTSYLQSMITNDVKKIDILPSVYSLFLNHTGRVLYDLIVYKVCDNEYFVEYDATGVEYVHKHLLMYRLRKDVNIEPIFDMSVWVIYKQYEDETNDENANFKDIFNHLNKVSNVKYAQDPRNKNLGIRILTKKDMDLPKLLELSGLNLLKTGSYQLLRYKLGIGEGVLDHPPGVCLPFDTNVDLLNGISFTKGCYIGQEMAAKSNFVLSVRKRLMPVILEEMDSYPIFPPECNILNDQQKKMGRLRSHLGRHGLALLKFEDSMKSNFLQLQGFDIKLKAMWPNWWPKNLNSNKNEHIYSV